MRLKRVLEWRIVITNKQKEHFMNLFSKIALAAAAMFLAAPVSSALAKDNKVVIQVSTGDQKVQNMALNNAVNLMKALGPGMVEVEIVAYGPGLAMFIENNPLADRVKSMALSADVTLTACGNTIAKITKKKGKAPKMAKGVTITKAGVVRIMQLQQKGYAYVRP